MKELQNFESNNFEQKNDMEIKDWKEEGFIAEDKLNEVKGPLVEMAGPTDEYSLVNRKKLLKEIHISNIYPGSPRFDGKTGKFIGFEGDVDFIADAKNIPLKENSAGALFFSCLSKTTLEKEDENKNSSLRQNAIREAWKVLGPGSILVWQGGDKSDYKYAQECGFKLLQCQTAGRDKNQNIRYDYIFEKEKK